MENIIICRSYLNSIVLFPVLLISKKTKRYWSDDWRSLDKWTCLTIVVFTSSAHFEEMKAILMRWSKIIWQMNISQYSSVPPFCLFRKKQAISIRWLKITWQMNMSQHSCVHLFRSFGRKESEIHRMIEDHRTNEHVSA